METAKQTIDTIYRGESRRVFANLVRILGDFDLAEDAMHEAFVFAAEKWPTAGIPENPVAWLISAGRFKAIDIIRRGARFQGLGEKELNLSDSMNEPEIVGDEVLRLIFTCCHPSLAPESQIALTLREVCELTTEEIAHAFLIPAPTLAQRIVRAKAKIRDAQIPFEMPSKEELQGRLASVLRIIYLVYNEGYSASSGASVIRRDLVVEAIRLTRLIVEMLPNEPEVAGLLGLMLIQASRRNTRLTAEGDLIPLDEQDRSLWDQELIQEGCAMTERALLTRRIGSYTLQAAISAVHAEAKTYEETDWEQIVGLYDALLRVEPSAVIELNRAVAVAMAEGIAQGLALVEDLLESGGLMHYHLAHAVRADFSRRLDRIDDARSAYKMAIQLAQQEPERRFLIKKLNLLQK